MEIISFILIIIGAILYFFARSRKNINWLSFGIFIFGIGTGMLIYSFYLVTLFDH
jgi:hypothetical protein